jgi:hypothetical protein
MATFRCLQSGNTVTFTYQHDIDSMRGHAGYVRVEDEKPPVETTAQPEPVKKIGRPKKVANV